MSNDAFVKAFISALEIEVEGVSDLQIGQEQSLETFKNQNIELNNLNKELEDISLIFSKLPEYQEKLDNLKKDMNFVSRKGVEIRERAKEVEKLKQQRKLADEKMLAQPASSIATTTTTSTTSK